MVTVTAYKSRLMKPVEKSQQINGTTINFKELAYIEVTIKK